MTQLLKDLIEERNYIEAKAFELEDYFVNVKSKHLINDYREMILLQIDIQRSLLKCLNYRIKKLESNV
jgi:hypothetical protein